MAKKKTQEQEFETQEAFETLDQFAQNTENFFEKNARYFAIGFGALVALSLGYFLFIKYYLEPNKAEAFKEYAVAQRHFAQDSLSKALGNETEGFAYLAKEKGNTAAGQISAFKAGSIEYQNKNYEKALSYFEQYNPDDKIAKAIVEGAKGDVYVQLGDNQKAYSQFKNAIEISNNGGTDLVFVKKAVLVAMELKNNKEALTILESFSKEYPDVDNTGFVDAYTGMLSEQ